MKKTFIPDAFREKYSGIMRSESEKFFSCCTTKIPKSLWVNSLKISHEKLIPVLVEKGWKLKALFNENSFSLEGIEKPGQSDEFKQGLFNLQEKSSMLPAIALSPEPGQLVLDATAAPGNKTLQLACMMQNTGKLIAVEKNVLRFKSLKFNMKKFSVKNVIAKRMDLLDAKKENLFDKALLDAPCSSEGLVRKNYEALKEWSPALVERKSELQMKLIAKTFMLLKNGGEMVYSTCSLGPEENEAVVQSVLSKGKAELMPIKIKGFETRKGLVEYNGNAFGKEMEKAVRIYPQDNDSQAFFFAKIRKTAT